MPWPKGARVEDPGAISFPDGSQPGFREVVHTRWERENGDNWSRITLSKGRIDPRSQLIIPRMKLTRAAISKRLAEFAKSIIAKRLERVIHLVGASTVPCHLYKEDQKLKPFEGA